MPRALLALALFISLLHTACSHTIPITRHQSTIQQTDCTATGPNSQNIVGFGNCYNNNIYYININIGTPPQTLGVQLDTGSDTLWIPTQFVAGATIFFNTTKSSTFTNTSTPGGVQYVDGSGVSGTYGTDVLALTNSPISITTQYLWVTSENGMNYPSAVQGLVGMGYSGPSNFLDVAYQNGEIGTPVFALEILDETQQSVVHYNQIPESITNSTIFVPVSGSFYWEVMVLDVTVGGIDMTDSAAGNAVIDSGTSYFYLNPDLYNAVISQFFMQRCVSVGGVPHCTCDIQNWPTFAFSFQGVQLFINPDQYQHTISTGVCAFLFGSISGISEILLGDIFFRKYIITFDKQNSQIGFSGSDMNPLPTISSTLNNVLGWILVALVGIVGVLGCVALGCLGRGSRSVFGGEGVYYGEMQLSKSAGLRAQMYY